MKKTLLLLFAVFTFLMAKESSSQEEALTISSLIGNNQILVIGESYGQSESTNFLAKKVAEYISGGNCLNVGLEIPSDQQEILDSAMRGQVSMSDVQIDNVVDHDSYREMLVSFSDQIIAGKCLSVYAINPPSSIPVIKDSWMEQEVVNMVNDRPSVILVQNKHAIKDVKITDDPDKKLLTQRLRARSFGVASVLQHWKPGGCLTKNVKIYDTTTDKKSVIYVKASIGELSAVMPEKASMVSDGVLVWSCDRITLKEVDPQVGDVANRKLIYEVSKYDVVERDEDVLKKIRWGIKHDYPIVGMNMDEAREAMGEPDEVEKAANAEKWVYQCSDDDGFDYECYNLKFSDGSLVKFDNLE
ncbi:MAG: hypothetical protein WBC96_06645 [Thermodesulfobacteriota bacterium]